MISSGCGIVSFTSAFPEHCSDPPPKPVNTRCVHYGSSVGDGNQARHRNRPSRQPRGNAGSRAGHRWYCAEKLQVFWINCATDPVKAERRSLRIHRGIGHGRQQRLRGHDPELSLVDQGLEALQRQVADTDAGERQPDRRAIRLLAESCALEATPSDQPAVEVAAGARSPIPGSGSSGCRVPAASACARSAPGRGSPSRRSAPRRAAGP